ncbi:hypothetical protein Tco_0782222 [Tanacetum coccineum]
MGAFGLTATHKGAFGCPSAGIFIESTNVIIQTTPRGRSLVSIAVYYEVTPLCIPAAFESIIPLNEIVSQIPPSTAITPILLTLDPEDSLIIGNEELSTIPKKESDEFIKSSVKDLVPIPSEPEDTFKNDGECDLSSCEDLSPINISKEKSVTFSNPLFDSNDDFTSSDDESLSDEDVPEDNVKIYSNPLFEYISSDVNPLFHEVLENIENIDVFADIKDGYHDSEGDIIYLESLLINDIILNIPPKVCLDHDPKNLKDKHDNEDLKSMVKVFNPKIHEKKISPTYVSLPFEDRHYLSLTYVIRIFLPYFTYLVDSSLLLSPGSEDTIFDPGISAFHFSALEPVASHRSGTFMCFDVYPNILNERLEEGDAPQRLEASYSATNRRGDHIVQDI